MAAPPADGGSKRPVKQGSFGMSTVEGGTDLEVIDRIAALVGAVETCLGGGLASEHEEPFERVAHGRPGGEVGGRVLSGRLDCSLGGGRWGLSASG